MGDITSVVVISVWNRVHAVVFMLFRTGFENPGAFGRPVYLLPMFRELGIIVLRRYQCSCSSRVINDSFLVHVASD